MDSTTLFHELKAAQATIETLEGIKDTYAKHTNQTNYPASFRDATLSGLYEAIASQQGHYMELCKMLVKCRQGKQA